MPNLFTILFSFGGGRGVGDEFAISVCIPIDDNKGSADEDEIWVTHWVVPSEST